MLKNISQLEVKINEKVIRLLADMDTETYVVKEALNQFLKFIEQIEEAAKQAREEEQKIEIIEE